MIYFGLILGIILIAFLVVPGKRNDRKWYFKNMHNLLNWIRRKWNIPQWIDETFLFHSWIAMFVGDVLLLFCLCWFHSDTITRLEKPVSGAGSVWEDVEIIWEDEGGKQHTEQFQIEIKEQQIEQEKIKQYFSAVKHIIEQQILGENESLDYVNKPLYLPEKVADYHAEIMWDSDCPWLMNEQGELGTKISEEGETVNLTATIMIQDQEDTFVVQVKVFPAEYNWIEDLKNTVNAMQSENLWLELPNEWNGISITWKKDNRILWMFLIILILSAPVLLFFKKRQEIEEKEKKERQQMLEDYPEIISKLMLLLSAGMSLRRAMDKLVSDYKVYYKQNGTRKAYELLAETCREIHCGVTEKHAYENIGERCDLLQYRTLSALLVQHLQKGNRGMEQMLSEEVRRAQELRQQQAKILGEQASAKLLLPMTIMLLDVLIILMVPAWISFSI